MLVAIFAIGKLIEISFPTVKTFCQVYKDNMMIGS
jgi:hypothetical protein